MKNYLKILIFGLLAFYSCRDNDPKPIDKPPLLAIGKVKLNGKLWTDNTIMKDVSITQKPTVEITFSEAVDIAKINKSMIAFTGDLGKNYQISSSMDKKTLIVNLDAIPQELTKYSFAIAKGDNLGGYINSAFTASFVTQLDSTYKFPLISDDNLLTLVQQNTFEYFREYAHPVSGMARERLGSGETVTTGGTGFGLMALLAGIERGFITREQGFQRLNTTVNKNVQQSFGVSHIRNNNQSGHSCKCKCNNFCNSGQRRSPFSTRKSQNCTYQHTDEAGSYKKHKVGNIHSPRYVITQAGYNQTIF